MALSLVLGATGNVGRAVVAGLAARGAAVKAAALDAAAGKFPQRVNAVPVQLESESDLRDAMAGVDRVFVLAPDFIPVDELAARAVRAARGTAVERMVLMTTIGDERNPAFARVQRAERTVARSGLQYTLLRPGSFMQNFAAPWFAERIRESGEIRLPAGDAPVSFVDARDVGEVAAAAMTGEGHHAERYTITGGRALTHSEAAEAISAAVGRPISYVNVSDAEFAAVLAKRGLGEQSVQEVLGMFREMREGVYAAVSPDVNRVLRRDPVTFETWAREFASAWRD